MPRSRHAIALSTLGFLAALASLAPAACLAGNDAPRNGTPAPSGFRNGLENTDSSPPTQSAFPEVFPGTQPSLECYQRGHRIYREEVSGMPRHSSADVTVTTRNERQILVFKVGEGMCIVTLPATAPKWPGQEVPAPR